MTTLRVDRLVQEDYSSPHKWGTVQRRRVTPGGRADCEKAEAVERNSALADGFNDAHARRLPPQAQEVSIQAKLHRHVRIAFTETNNETFKMLNHCRVHSGSMIPAAMHGSPSLVVHSKVMILIATSLFGVCNVS